MTPRAASALAALLLAACSSQPAVPGGNTTRCSMYCDAASSGPNGGGGFTGTLDAGDASDAAASLDGAAPDASRAFTGRLRTFRDLPPPDGVTPAGAGGWTLTALPPPNDADAAALPTVTTQTLPNGDFTFVTTPPSWPLPGEGATGVWLSASSAVMGRLTSVFAVRDGTADLVLDTVTDDTLRAALAATTTVQADDRAVVAVLVRQSTARDALATTGVRVEAEGQSSETLYDAVSGLLELSATGTGRRGFALVPNVAVPGNGDGFVTVRVARAPRAYTVRVRRGAVSWLLAVAN